VRTWTGLLIGTLGLVLLWVYLTGPLLECGGECFVDYRAMRGEVLGRLEVADARLNSWILGWVHHVLLGGAGSLFDANIFYPSRNTLAASEHLLGIAVPLLPLAAAGAGPVALHQTALVASFLLSALTTAALVRWLTRSSFAAFAAGAAALFMPWRISELSHIQLLNSQWIPLVWLMLGRILYRDRPRAATVWLSVVFTLQALSSFYLAYFLLLSCALLVPLLWLRTGIERAVVLRLGGAALLPALAIALAALPYLTWQQSSGFVPVAELFDSVSLSDAWSMLRPALGPGLGTPLLRPISYGLPLGVCALAAVTLVPGRGSAADEREPRRRGFVLGLWSISAIAFVLTLGRKLQLGDASIALPAEWLARLVPGFDHMRSPLRWALLIGIATPVLAGVGAWRLERLAAAHRGERGQLALRAVVAVALVLSLPSGRLPARGAWMDSPETRALYRALAGLPDGAVVEIPWPLGVPRNVEVSSRYVLASTRHWKPIANGTSGYYPHSYALMSEVASRLPAPEALGQLRRLVDARWIVVHGDRLPPPQRLEWARAAREGHLSVAYRSRMHRIYEIARTADTGRYMEALRSTAPRPLTFAGLPRAPLLLPTPAGGLEASAAGPMFIRGPNRIPSLVSLQVTNASDLTWPAFDLDPRGIVRVRYTFEQNGGSAALTDTAALIVDLPPGRTSTMVALRPPARVGDYRLRLELIQQQGGRDRLLPVAAAELEVAVEEAARPPSGD
jgi:hypothetical protein